MVLLSFSVKEAELKAGTKIRTTRLYTPEKWEQWGRTLPGGDLLLNGYWKPRTKDGYRLFNRNGTNRYRLTFRWFNGRPWVAFETQHMSGVFVPATYPEMRTWAKEEGFEGEEEQLLRFFQEHYLPLEGNIFQSIAFPPAVV